MKLTNQELSDLIRHEYLYSSIDRTSLALKYNVPIKKVYRSIGHGKLHVNFELIAEIELEIRKGTLSISAIAQKYKASEELIVKIYSEIR